MMTKKKKPTRAQRKALEYVRDNGPCCRPWIWISTAVRGDVWRRCIGAGWIEEGDRWLTFVITDAGREVIR